MPKKGFRYYAFFVSRFALQRGMCVYIVFISLVMGLRCACKIGNLEGTVHHGFGSVFGAIDARRAYKLQIAHIAHAMKLLLEISR
jgi:hypothetical protein